MANPTLASPFFSDTLTIPAATRTNLLEAMQAINPNISGSATYLSVQAGAADVFLGGSNVDSTRYGEKIAAGFPIRLSAGVTGSNIPLSEFWVYITAGGDVHVTVIA